MRIRETITFTCVDSPTEEQEYACGHLRLQNENNKCLKVTRDRGALSFCFVNYLGRTRIQNASGETALKFEIVPTKCTINRTTSS